MSASPATSSPPSNAGSHPGFAHGWSHYRSTLSHVRPETRPAERWATLARKKLTELDELVARAEKMKALLEVGLRCGGLRLEDRELVTGRGCQTELPIPIPDGGAS
jgi:hypothetical protein